MSSRSSKDIAQLLDLVSDPVPVGYMALENGHPGLVQLLLDHGADPNTRYINGLTLPHVSSQLGDLKVVQELLLKRVSINHVKFPIDRIPIMDILSIGNFTGVFHQVCGIPSMDYRNR